MSGTQSVGGAGKNKLTSSVGLPSNRTQVDREQGCVLGRAELLRAAHENLWSRGCQWSQGVLHTPVKYSMHVWAGGKRENTGFPQTVKMGSKDS